MGLRDIGLKEEYRSDRDDIVAEFFFPCLSNCIEYDRCVDFLSIQSLATIAMVFENFSSGKAKIRMITGHRFKTAELGILTKLFSEKYTKKFDGKKIKDSKIQKLQDLVNNGQIELKVAITNSEHVTNAFSERIGLFLDEDDQIVAFGGTSNESFSTQTQDFESVDVLLHGTINQELTEKERILKNCGKTKQSMLKFMIFYLQRKTTC